MNFLEDVEDVKAIYGKHFANSFAKEQNTKGGEQQQQPRQQAWLTSKTTSAAAPATPAVAAVAAVYVQMLKNHSHLQLPQERSSQNVRSNTSSSHNCEHSVQIMS